MSVGTPLLINTELLLIDPIRKGLSFPDCSEIQPGVNTGVDLINAGDVGTVKVVPAWGVLANGVADWGVLLAVVGALGTAYISDSLRGVVVRSSAS